MRQEREEFFLVIKNMLIKHYILRFYDFETFPIKKQSHKIKFKDVIKGYTEAAQYTC